MHADTSSQGCFQDVPWVESKLQEVVGIIPDLSGKIDRMKASIIIELVTDTKVSLLAVVHRFFLKITCTTLGVAQAVAQQVLDLRTLLPRVDVSRMMAQHPHLIFKLEPSKVSQQLDSLRQALTSSSSQLPT